MRGWALRVAGLFSLLFLPFVANPVAHAADRSRQIESGLRFIYKSARNPRNFQEFGCDYLWCFYSIAATSKDPALIRRASEMALERGREWRRNVKIPTNAGPDEIADLAFGGYALQQLGIPDDAFKQRIRDAASKFSPVDFLLFDPAKEAPPADLPERCPMCRFQNARGAVKCTRCESPLKMHDRYDLWDDALITTYTGDCYGVTLGGHYRDAVKWLRTMRPYPPRETSTVPEFYATLYAITHLVYTLNGYSLYHLAPEWLPDEYAYLKSNLTQAIAMRDPETMGEFLDTLRSFGMTEADPLMRTGVDYLRGSQNRDGSWGNPKERDVYNRYHSAWTAIDGLREYAWHGERLSFPELRDLLN